MKKTEKPVLAAKRRRVCKYMHVSLCIHLSISTSVSIPVHCVCVCIWIRIYDRIYVLLCICIYTCIHICMRMWMSMSMYMYICMCACVCTLTLCSTDSFSSSFMHTLYEPMNPHQSAHPTALTSYTPWQTHDQNMYLWASNVFVVMYSLTVYHMLHIYAMQSTI